MPKIAKNLTKLIGNTPLVQLSNFAVKQGVKARLIVKLEAYNPAGSVKDRIALSMVEDAEAKGLLKPGVDCGAYQWQYGNRFGHGSCR